MTSLISAALCLVVFGLMLLAQRGMDKLFIPRTKRPLLTACVAAAADTIVLALVGRLMGGFIGNFFGITVFSGLLVLFVQYRICYRGDTMMFFWAALNFAFLFGCVNGAFNTLLALCLQSSITRALAIDGIYLLCLVLTLLALCAIRFHEARALRGARTNCLLDSPAQLRFVLAVELALFAFQMFASYSEKYQMKEIWYHLFFLSGHIALLLCYATSIAQATRCSAWMEEDLKVRILEEQIERQMHHYEGYQYFVEEFRSFRADYERLTGELRHHILEGSGVDALQTLDDAALRAQALKPRREYSNEPIVDAILQDIAVACTGAGIRFEANVFLPSWLGRSDLELCRVFSNICKNALDACRAMPQEKKRYIRLLGGVAQGWSTVTAENTFAGEIRVEEGKLLTTKANACLHGVGISSIKTIVEHAGGFLNISIDRSAGVFRISLHLAQPGNK